ncbi:MAG: hypothetical protein Q8O13_07565, partial [Candidatus Omnitrophota bacterium]|nr:hypothetical protein [Candidatus Omnitrophota bacterium]
TEVLTSEGYAFVLTSGAESQEVKLSLIKALFTLGWLYNVQRHDKTITVQLKSTRNLHVLRDWELNKPGIMKKIDEIIKEGNQTIVLMHLVTTPITRGAAYVLDTLAPGLLGRIKAGDVIVAEIPAFELYLPKDRMSKFLDGASFFDKFMGYPDTPRSLSAVVENERILITLAESIQYGQIKAALAASVDAPEKFQFNLNGEKVDPDILESLLILGGISFPLGPIEPHISKKGVKSYDLFFAGLKVALIKGSHAIEKYGMQTLLGQWDRNGVRHFVIPASGQEEGEIREKKNHFEEWNNIRLCPYNPVLGSVRFYKEGIKYLTVTNIEELIKNKDVIAALALTMTAWPITAEMKKNYRSINNHLFGQASTSI